MTLDGSCRLCRGYCDWVVDPVHCRDQRCPNLYGYDDEHGRRIVGCLERVFTAEVDVEALADLSAAGGVHRSALRAARRPFAYCDGRVEVAFPKRITNVGCIDPEFGEASGADPFRVVEHT